MSKRYPRGQNFVKKTFHQFFTTDTIKWFEERDVKLKAEKDGRMFPVTDSSQTIIDCLMNEANSYGVEIRMNSEVKENPTMKILQFGIHLANGQLITANFRCYRLWWLSKSFYVSMADKIWDILFQNRFLLYSLLILPKHPITELMGVSVEKVRVKIEGSKLVEEGPVLITHWGLSGPAVLRLSAWGARELRVMNYEFKVHINWLPGLQ